MTENKDVKQVDHIPDVEVNNKSEEISIYDEKMGQRVISSNIGNAKLGGLEDDLAMTKEEYQWSLSIFYFGYVVFEIPANIVMRKWVPASYWLGIMMFLWGVVAVCMAASTSAVGIIIGRFFLGLFESGAFGGLIAYGISQIPTDKLGTWQWLFIIEGVPSVILAVWAGWWLPNDPESAKFLTEEERAVAVGRLANDSGPSNDHSFAWPQVVSVFVDWKAYAFALIYISGTTALQGVTLFLPSIVNNIGHWSKAESQALTTPPYFLAFIATLAIGWSSDRYFERAYHMIFINVFAMVGFLLLMLVDHSLLGVHYFAACLVTMTVYANVAVKVAWFNNNFAGLTKKAVASAFIISIGTIGGAIGGQIYRDPPTYFQGNLISLCMVAVQTVLCIAVRYALARENKRRENMTDEMKEYEVHKHGGIDLVGDRHPDFRYVL
ncbi:major facilitator superfamily domain-containing protein [Cunninghamella echinulata]|nr:major facilitator superfamily domain-containing protein [Cunninghamella echinulata]